jgi:hypothetical protein
MQLLIFVLITLLNIDKDMRNLMFTTTQISQVTIKEVNQVMRNL